MAENPHWYIVFPFDPATAERPGFYALRDLVVRHGWDRRWHGTKYRTFVLDGFDYWHIWPVVNRKPTETAGWDEADLVLF